MLRELTKLVAVVMAGAALIQAVSRPPVEVRLGAATLSLTLRG